MAKIEIIGNIGADCKKVECNGSKFYTINVCDNRKVGDHEESMWYACNMNQVSENLQKFLVKGQQVFVRGVPGTEYSIQPSIIVKWLLLMCS